MPYLLLLYKKNNYFYIFSQDKIIGRCICKQTSIADCVSIDTDLEQRCAQFIW